MTKRPGGDPYMVLRIVRSHRTYLLPRIHHSHAWQLYLYKIVILVQFLHIDYTKKICRQCNDWLDEEDFTPGHTICTLCEKR